MTDWTEYLSCKDCYWDGTSDELVRKTDNPTDKKFTYCPGCGGTDFDIEEVEEE